MARYDVGAFNLDACARALEVVLELLAEVQGASEGDSSVCLLLPFVTSGRPPVVVNRCI